MGSCEESVNHVRIAGRYVAWAYDVLCGGEAHYVLRADVRRGRSLRGQPTGVRSCPQPATSCPGVGIGPVTRLVLDKGASTAWIAGNGETAEVWRYDGRGRGLLARGPDVDRSFLRLRAHRVTWRQGGSAHRASLRP